MKKLPKGSYVWADRRKVHKQGKVLEDYLPKFKGELYQGMQPIMPVPQSALDRPLLNDYPDFWVDPNDLVEVDIFVPIPTPSGITDEQAGQAFVALVRWLSTVFTK